MDKPQLITLSPIGDVNADLGLKVERLKKQAAWKKQRIVVIIPAGKSIPVEAYLAHSGLIFPPNNGTVRIAAKGAEVGEAFTSAFNMVLSHPELSTWEYILTVEHDNIPHFGGVIQLLKRMEENPKLDCVGGLYFLKGEDGLGGHAQIWGDINDPQLNFRPQLPDPNGGLVECYGTGMGFNLWRISSFKKKKIPNPLFKTVKENGVGTQDLYFWGEARKLDNWRCAIDCHPHARVGHLDINTGIIY